MLIAGGVAALEIPFLLRSRGEKKGTGRPRGARIGPGDVRALLLSTGTRPSGAGGQLANEFGAASARAGGSQGSSQMTDTNKAHAVSRSALLANPPNSKIRGRWHLNLRPNFNSQRQGGCGAEQGGGVVPRPSGAKGLERRSQPGMRRTLPRGPSKIPNFQRMEVLGTLSERRSGLRARPGLMGGWVGNGRWRSHGAGGGGLRHGRRWRSGP